MAKDNDAVRTLAGPDLHGWAMGGGKNLRRPYPIKSALRGKATKRAPYPSQENSNTRGDGMLIVPTKEFRRLVAFRSCYSHRLTP